MIAQATGMTSTQVVEEALRAYVPPSEANVAARLVRRGAILVKPAAGKRVSLADADTALDEARAERG